MTRDDPLSTRTSEPRWGENRRVFSHHVTSMTDFIFAQLPSKSIQYTVLMVYEVI